MADAIVQTIRVQVEGTEEAAAEFKKLGDAGAQSAEQLQNAVAPAAQGAGKGLDQVADKASISGGQLKALGKVAKTIGGEGGELAGVAIAFTRMAKSMGAIGIAVFAAAEAFSFIKGEMKKAEEAAKAVTASFANIAKVSAEMKVEDEAKFWGTTAEAMKKFANDAGRVADQLRNIAAGAKEAISPLTSEETLGKAFVKNLERAGISVNDVMADTTKLTEASRQAALEAAKLYEKMSPIEKLNFEKVLKSLGFTDEQIKNIEKGSKALKQAQDAARRPFFTPEQQASIDNLIKGWDRFAEAAQRAWEMVAGGGATGAGASFAAKVATGFADVLAVVGQFERAAVQVLSRLPDEVAQFVTTAPGNAWAWIKDTAASVWEQVKTAAQQAYDGVVAFVTAAPGNAWAWIAETFNSVVTGPLKSAADAVTQFITSWVTTPIASAWAWIVDAWNAMLAKLGFGGGQAAPAPAGGGSGFARGGLLGGRGSGTSDSNLAWVSRGEHIMPAHVVRQPGVLELLERLRFAGGNLRGIFNGMRFAAGGLIMPRAVPAFAGGGMHNVTIQFPGLPEITGLRASSGVVDELRRAAAMAQVRSGGRKPSRYS